MLNKDVSDLHTKFAPESQFFLLMPRQASFFPRQSGFCFSIINPAQILYASSRFGTLIRLLTA